jgi:hypothetical protein
MKGGCWEEGRWTGWAGDVVGNEGLGVGVVDGGWRWVGGVGGGGWLTPLPMLNQTHTSQPLRRDAKVHQDSLQQTIEARGRGVITVQPPLLQ